MFKNATFLSFYFADNQLFSNSETFVNYMRILNLDNLLKEENQLFNQIALDTRIPFNSLVEDISMPYVNNIHWIVGSIASRNKYSSPLFYRCCQLAFIRKQIELHGVIDEIILSDKPLATLLEDQLVGNIKINCTESKSQALWRFFRPYRQFLIAVYFFMLRFLGRSKFGKKRLKQNEEITLVETFVLNNKPGDGGSISNRKYSDRYYPGMLENLTDQEKENLFFIPTAVGFTNPIKIFKTIRTAEYPFVIHDDFLKLSDYLFILSQPFKLLRLPVASAFFLGFDLNSILIQENKRNCSDFMSLLGILNYRFADRLRKANIKVKVLIDWYENQVMDRGMIAGFRKFHPQTTIVGYQGYVISKGLHLYAQPNNTEFLGQAVPDKVAVTGKGLKNNILEFCNKINVEVAPGFRFGKVWRDRLYFPDPDLFTILIGLPIGLEDSKHILELVSNDAELMQNKKLSFHVKPHPTWRPEKIKGLFSKGEIDNFNFIIGEFHDCLEVANLIISNASSVALEALAKGVPVIIIAPSTGILQNPIPDEVDKVCWSISYSSEDLKRDIYNFIEKQKNKSIDFDTLGKSIRSEYFEPVTREGVLKFLEL